MSVAQKQPFLRLGELTLWDLLGADGIVTVSIPGVADKLPSIGPNGIFPNTEEKSFNK